MLQDRKPTSCRWLRQLPQHAESSPTDGSGGVGGGGVAASCCRVCVATGESGEGGLEFFGSEDLDVGVEPAECGSQTRPGPGALDEFAAIGAEFFDESVVAVGGHDGGGKVEDDFADARPCRGVCGASEPCGDECGHVWSGELTVNGRSSE